MATEEQMVITAKLVAMGVLFTASMTLGALPLLLAKLLNWNSDAKNNTYVKMLLCLGGGILLCTTFLHLLPEVSEKIRQLDYMPNYKIHYGELLMCTGFFTMYFLEECVHAYIHRKTHATKHHVDLETPDGNKKDDQQHHHHHFTIEDEETAVKTIRGLFVVLALSVHEMFEGLAVGLEASRSNVWYMFGAVSAHKLVISFCIGVELVTSGMQKHLVLIYVFTFAVVSPIGIAMGIMVSKSGDDATTLPSILLQGLASGTLLYVVFFEILSSERKDGLCQFLAVFVGFSFMLAITVLG